MTGALILTFFSVFLAVFAVFLLIADARQSPAAKLKRRLRQMDAKGSGSDRPYEMIMDQLLREPSSAEKVVLRLPFMKMVKKLVEHSGLKVTMQRFVSLAVAASSLVFLALYIMKGKMLIALPAAIVTLLVPFLYLGYCKQRRQDLFAEQLPDTLTMLARSLRAGHSLTAAVELVGQEMPEPTGELFRAAYEQQKLGMRMADSLRTLPDRIDSIDLHFFVTIVRINSETGGNLAEILENLGNTITSRLQVRRQVKVYTAEGRLSAYVLAILPVFVFALFYWRNPVYMNVFFTDKICQLFLWGAILGQLVGFYSMRKIVDIRI